MKRYRMRPEAVDAIQFDGSASGVERVVAWMARVAPGMPIRPRTEYAGWDDLTGHLELEVKDSEHGCMAGDWVVVTEAGGKRAAWFVDDAMFQRYSEEVEG
jgi:hypothetical protein